MHAQPQATPGHVLQLAPAGPRPAGLQTCVAPARQTAVAPIAADRYLLRVTIGGETHRKLQRARDLLRHVMPDGDPAAIVDRALTLLVEQLEKRKTAVTSRPRRGGMASTPRSRRVPAAVRRAVWSRDGGRCAFVGALGRCQETGFLEFHHLEPFAAGGATTVANLELRRRAHNAHEVTLYLGRRGER